MDNKPACSWQQRPFMLHKRRKIVSHLDAVATTLAALSARRSAEIKFATVDMMSIVDIVIWTC
jgi:hypothetical protein